LNGRSYGTTKPELVEGKFVLRKISIFVYLDAITPTVCLGHFIGR
jgi:prolipoprotein diacylglyceryltransferase